MNNSVIYVIGGSGLIGKSFISEIATDYRTIVNLDLVNNISVKSIFFEKFDCSNLLKIENKLNKIFKKYGEPGSLVNCSYPVSKDWNKSNFKSIKINNFITNLNWNLGSYSWISKIFADRMKKKGGKILMLGSVYGSSVAQDNSLYLNTKLKENMTYPIIKSGLVGLCKQMAHYYGRYNIQVNIVSPGLIKGHVKGVSKKQDKKFIKKYLLKTSLKRICKPEEVANLISFLISDKNSYITGQSIIIDGGYSVA